MEFPALAFSKDRREENNHICHVQQAYCVVLAHHLFSCLGSQFCWLGDAEGVQGFGGDVFLNFALPSRNAQHALSTCKTPRYLGNIVLYRRYMIGYLLERTDSYLARQNLIPQEHPHSSSISRSCCSSEDSFAVAKMTATSANSCILDFITLGGSLNRVVSPF